MTKVCEDEIKDFSDSSDNYEPNSSKSSSNSSTSSSVPKNRRTDNATPSAEDSGPEPSLLKKEKRRQQNIENWMKVETKMLKNSGKRYRSRTEKIVETKQIRPTCHREMYFIVFKTTI